MSTASPYSISVCNIRQNAKPFALCRVQGKAQTGICTLWTLFCHLFAEHARSIERSCFTFGNVVGITMVVLSTYPSTYCKVFQVLYLRFKVFLLYYYCKIFLNHYPFLLNPPFLLYFFFNTKQSMSAFCLLYVGHVFVNVLY
jgi:hypothetical protein